MPPPGALSYPSHVVRGQDGREMAIGGFSGVFQRVLGLTAFNFIKIPDIWTRSTAD